jgi:hypothetical protein
VTRGAILLLLGLGATPAPAQTPVRTTLVRLEDGWAAALVRRDAGYFQRTLAQGFVYSEDAKSFTRTEVLRSLLDPSDSVREAHNEAMVVHEFGGTAIVTGWLIVKGHNASGPYEHRYRFTDTWMRQAGSWRIVAAHDYLTPQR